MVLLLCIGFAATAHARDSEDFLIRRYELTVIVECLDEAILQMRDLPGLEVNSLINITAGHGQALRVIDTRDLGLALDIIRGMGSVTHSESQADNGFSRWVALRRETVVRQHEYDRLVELLHESTLMADFEMIESRLNVVINTMDRLRGGFAGFRISNGNH